MATSSSVHTNTYGGRTITLKVEEIGTSIDNNTSTIKWTLTSGTSGTYHSVYEITAWVGGTDTAHRVYGPKTADWSTRAFPCKDGSTSGTLTITHKQDGTADPLPFRLRGSVYTNSPQNYDGSITLTTIPRASQIGVADANIGSSTNITINKNSQSFTTTLYYKASGQSSWTKIVDKTSNQVYAWTVPTSFYSLIPNSKTITCQFYAETYNGSTLVGTSSTVTATFTATGNPTINSFTLVDTNSTTIALTGDSSKMVRYASNVKATVSTSGQNSATISSNKVNGTATSSGVVTFNGASTNSYQLIVTDSRGYTTSQTKTMTMVNYIQLSLNAVIVRNQPTDGKIKISYSGNYFNGSFGSQSNSLTVQYRSREKNGTWGNWTNLSPTISGNTYSQSNYQLSGYDYKKQYEFEIRAVDKVQTKPITGISIPKGEPIYWWNDDNFNINGNSQIIGDVELANVKSKNLLNNLVYNTRTSGVGYGVQVNKSVYVDSQSKAWAWVQFLQRYIPTNTTLTFSCSFTANGNANIVVIIYDANDNTLGSSDNTTATSGNISFTFTTTTPTIKIRFSANNSSSTIQNTVLFSKIMIEKGSNPTAYGEYQPLDGRQIYSLAETMIGYWINGKPIYRRVVQFNPSTSALETSISHNISNIDEIIPTSKCMLHRTGNQFVPFSMTYPDASTSILAWSIGWEANRTNIITWIGSSMRNQMDTSSYGYGAVAILEYTKLTD